MGRGNYYHEGLVCYVDNDDFYVNVLECSGCNEETSDGDVENLKQCPKCGSSDIKVDRRYEECFYEDFEANLSGVLDAAGVPFEFPEKKWEERDMKVLAENQYVKVCLADNEWSTAVVVIDKGEDDEDGEGENRPIDLLGELFKKTIGQTIIDGLIEMYDLYSRDGAWTSSKIEVKKAA